MDPNKVAQQVAQEQPVNKNKFPKWLITVTPFSRALALSMLIIFPIIGFYLGVIYKSSQQPKIINTFTKNITTNNKLTLAPTAVVAKDNKDSEDWKIFDENKNGIYDLSSWKLFTSNDNQFSLSYPDDWIVKETNDKKNNCAPIYKSDDNCKIVTLSKKFIPTFSTETESHWYSTARPPFYINFSITREINKNNIKNLDNLFQDAIVKTNSIRAPFYKNGKLIDYEIITVGNLKFLRYTWYGVQPEYVFIFLKDNYVYTVEYGLYEDFWYDFVTQTVLAQVLGSFK